MTGDLRLSRRAFLEATGGLVALGTLGLVARHTPVAPYVKRFLALGTRVTLVIPQVDGRLAATAARLAIREMLAVHELATLFEPSLTSFCNEQAFGRAVVVPRSLYDLLDDSRACARRTEGLFDVTIGAVTRFYRETPGVDDLAALRESVGISNLALDADTTSVRLLHPRTALDLNGIAKGFAVDRAVAAMRQSGLTDFLINAGGEIYAAGHGPGRASGWLVRVEAPDPEAPPLLEEVIEDQAIATSGNQFQASAANGARWSHLFDARSGVACDELSSATIVSASATEADAWSTAAFVAGPDRAPALVGCQAGLEALLIGKDGRVARG